MKLVIIFKIRDENNEMSKHSKLLIGFNECVA